MTQRKDPNAWLDDLAQIKRLTTIALTSDPALGQLVLKGGTAVDLVYGIAARTSIDLDFSMEGDIGENPEAVRLRIAAALEAAFASISLRVFDVEFGPQPEHVTPDLADFWGGYVLRFKVIPQDRAALAGDDLQAMRRLASIVGPSQRRTFEVDISRFEYCGDQLDAAIDGRTVAVYSPRLIVAEKLRAICQQMPEYRRLVKSPNAHPRARDFFDIHALVAQFAVEVDTLDFLRLVERVFAAKRVPMELLARISETREFHGGDFSSVLDTADPATVLFDFSGYFDFVIRIAAHLETLRNMQAP